MLPCLKVFEIASISIKFHFLVALVTEISDKAFKAVANSRKIPLKIDKKDKKAQTWIQRHVRHTITVANSCVYCGEKLVQGHIREPKEVFNVRLRI